MEGGRRSFKSCLTPSLSHLHVECRFLSMTLTEMGKNLCVITCEMGFLSLQCKHIITLIH